MKKLLLLTLISFFSFIKILKANETEPNNTSQQANILALNGNDTGIIIQGDKDWWKITVNATGKLRVSFTSLSKAELRASIFEPDATTRIAYGDSKNNHYVILLAGVTPGVYYIKIGGLTDNSAGDYKLSDTLVEMPLPPSDAEPNNYAKQALTLPVNGMVSGSLGYYDNGYTDARDWYKIKVSSYCNLRLKLTSNNKGYFYAWLSADTNFRSFPITLTTANNTAKEERTGIAPGTYYIKVNINEGYVGSFGTYTLSDSIITTGIPQDDEPNNSFAQANILPVNSSKSGNVGFTNFDKFTDNGDFYKIVIPTDGNIHFKLNPSQVQSNYIEADFYNADTSHLIDVITGDYNRNLFAGTYYLIVYNYNSHGVYTLEDSFYSVNTDATEPNNKPYEAKTIPDYTFALGRLNNNINGGRDSADWWKINNTSNVNKDNQGYISYYVPQNADSTADVCFDVYSDTSGAVIDHEEIKRGTDSIAYFEFHSLNYGYFWIKVYPKKNTVFSTYSIQPSYDQYKGAKYNVYYKDTNAECSGNNTIIYRPKVDEPNYNGPVIYQLYRYNIPYRLPDTVAQTGLATFSNLPQGYYTVSAIVDGAGRSNYTWMPDITKPFENHIDLEPIPDSLKTQFITNTKARLSWDAVECATYYIIHYKKQGDDAWITKKVAGDKTYWRLDSLAENTTYIWKVATEHITNGIEAEGFFSNVATFTTSSTGLIAGANELRISNNLNHNSIIISPNPAKSYFILSYNSNTLKKVNAILYDVNGKAVWSSGLVSANTLNNKKVFTSQFANGVYYFKLMDEQGADISKAMITIAK